ncbi:hypothetical protein NQZ68_024986 [Dissostichus eleginoides]|nr:hypothetical protein NQZ68_024986 [Dissostichus eleginoides]
MESALKRIASGKLGTISAITVEFTYNILLEKDFACDCELQHSGCDSFMVLPAFLVGLLWVAFVLLDGDWYVCCKNDGSKQQVQLACKAEANITDNERVIIEELKNSSQKLIFTEEENVLEEVLMKAVKEKLAEEVKEKTRDKPWNEYKGTAKALFDEAMAQLINS